MSITGPLNTFTEIAKNIYNSEIFSLKNVNQINKWCEKQTNGKIILFNLIKIHQICLKMGKGEQFN